jgi:hypothetical protein
MDKETIQSKYFTPSIEDIRVGYECEIERYSYIYSDGGPSQKVAVWDPFVVTEDYLARGYAESYFTGEQLRVPYLTKEQIEAEGWRFIEHNKVINLLAFRIDINEHSWYELDYYTDSKTLLIDKYYCNGDDNLGLFNGSCKDINTFRYITKLLNIN